MNASRLIFGVLQIKGYQMKFGKSILQIKHSLQPRSYIKSSCSLKLPEKCIIRRGSYRLQDTSQPSNYVYFCTSKKSADISTDEGKDYELEDKNRTTTEERTDIGKEVPDSDSWKLIYDFQGTKKVQRMQVFSRAQIVMTIAAIPTIFLYNPGTGGLCMGLFMMFATHLMMSAARNIRRFIVAVCVDETSEKLRFTFINSWGKKVYIYKDTTDIVPLSDFRQFVNKNIMRVMTYQKEEYLLVPKFIDEQNMEDLKKVLGDFEI